MAYKEVNENRDDDEITVFFVDYGDSDVVKRCDIYPLEQHFVRTCPFQAIECSLKDVEPLNEPTWTLESGDMMWSLTHSPDWTHLNCRARVVRKELLENSSASLENFIESSQKRYIVKLFTESSPEYIDIAHKLVELKWARLTQEEEDYTFKAAKFPLSSSKIASLASQFLDYFIMYTFKKDLFA